MSHPLSLIAAFDRLALPEVVRALVIERYGEAHRGYHTLRHIDLMLRQLPPSHAFTPEMMAATLFHDIIYDPTRSDNEERSQMLFERYAFAPGLDRPLVSAMILATRSHRFRAERTEQDEAINLLLKADLSILWHPDPDMYAWYAAGVRKEYGFVPEERFREARAKILIGLRDDLLASDHLTTAEADMLRRNIDWELG